MAGLKYIIIGRLPGREKMYLEENLKTDLQDKQEGLAEKIQKRKLVDSEAPGASCEMRVVIKKSNEKLADFPAAESLLVSGNDGELHEAAGLGMAALGYLAPAQNRDWECTERAGETSGSTRTPPADMYAEGFEEIGFTFLQHVYERHHHIPWTILTTERCVVKEFSMEYLDDLFALYAWEGMTDYIEPLFPYEEEREYQQAYIENMYRFYGYGMWIVCDRETGALIGRAGVEHREELSGELELGYAIGVPYRRKGYAAEVCEAILSYVQEELGFEEISCLIDRENHISVAFARKLGFVCEGTLELDGKKMRKYVKHL